MTDVFNRREKVCGECRWLDKNGPMISFKGVRYWCPTKQEWKQHDDKFCDTFQLDLWGCN